jgi:hypothetical protein
MQTTYTSLNELFSRPSRWIKNEDAVDKAGNHVDAESTEAVAWCLSAGITRVYGDSEANELQDVRVKLIKWIQQNLDPAVNDLATWNDASDRTFRDIRKAIVGAGI